MAMINEGEDVIETGEEVVANVKQFLQSGCACSKSLKSGPCSRQFSEDSVLANLNNCLELTHGELDLVILANIQALTAIEIVGEKRKRCLRSSFSFQSKTICNVFKPLWDQLFPIPKAERTLRRKRCIFKGSWEPKENTAQRCSAVRDGRSEELPEQFRRGKCRSSTWQDPRFQE